MLGSLKRVHAAGIDHDVDEASPNWSRPESITSFGGGCWPAPAGCSAAAILDTVTSSADPGPAERAEVADDLERGLPMLVRWLTPLERTVLLLREEVFGYSYAEMARLVGKPECNCRQVKVRARRHLKASPDGSAVFDAPKQRAWLGHSSTPSSTATLGSGRRSDLT